MASIDSFETASAPNQLPWPPATKAWFTVGCIIVAAFLCTMDRLVLNLLVDPIRSDLHITETQFSLLQGISFTMINSLTALPLGLYVDRTSRRNILVLGILIWSLATALGGLSTTFGEFLAARLFVGAGEAALWPVAVSMIADVLPASRRGRAVGLVLLGQILGSGASLILTGVVMRLAPTGFFNFLPGIGDLTPWRLVLVLWGALGLVAIGLLVTIPEPLRRSVEARSVSATGMTPFLHHVWRCRRILLPVYVGACMISVGTYSLAAWVPAFFIRHFHATPGQIGPILGIVGICAGVLGTTVGGFLADFFEMRGTRDRKLLLMTLASLACLPVTLLIVAPNIGAAVFLQSISLLFFPAVGMTTTLVVQDLVPNEMRGKAMAVLTMFSSMLGATIGPTLTASVTQYVYRDDQMVGYSIATVLLPALLIAALCFYSARRALRQQPETTTANGSPQLA